MSSAKRTSRIDPMTCGSARRRRSPCRCRGDPGDEARGGGGCASRSRRSLRPRPAGDRPIGVNGLVGAVEHARSDVGVADGHGIEVVCRHVDAASGHSGRRDRQRRFGSVGAMACCSTAGGVYGLRRRSRPSLGRDASPLRHGHAPGSRARPARARQGGHLPVRADGVRATAHRPRPGDAGVRRARPLPALVRASRCGSCPT